MNTKALIAGARGYVYTAAAYTLTDTTELAVRLSHTAGRCLASGLDPDSYRGVLRACFTLGQRPWRPSAAWRDDQEMFADVEDIRVVIAATLARIDAKTEETAIRLAVELAEDEEDRNGQVIADCHGALQILADGRPVFVTVSNLLMPVADDTFDTYQAAYALVDSGHVMPHEGRFMTGDTH